MQKGSVVIDECMLICVSSLLQKGRVYWNICAEVTAEWRTWGRPDNQGPSDETHPDFGPKDDEWAGRGPDPHGWYDVWADKDRKKGW